MQQDSFHVHRSVAVTMTVRCFRGLAAMGVVVVIAVSVNERGGLA